MIFKVISDIVDLVVQDSHIVDVVVLLHFLEGIHVTLLMVDFLTLGTHCDPLYIYKTDLLQPVFDQFGLSDTFGLWKPNLLSIRLGPDTGARSVMQPVTSLRVARHFPTYFSYERSSTSFEPTGQVFCKMDRHHLRRAPPLT